MRTLVPPPQPRLVTATALGDRILDSYQQSVWPCGLARFKLFTRDREKGHHVFRPVAWEASSRSLYVLRIMSDKPAGIGQWERWEVDGPDKPLEDVRPISDLVTPVYMTNVSKPIRPSSLKGMERRKAILEAYCYVDIDVGGTRQQMFNPFVLSDAEERSAALRYVYEALRQPKGYQSYILGLFHVYVFYGDAPRAMAKRTDQQGGPSGSRVGANSKRPGPNTGEEARAAMRTKMLGDAPMVRRGPVRPSDIVKFVDAIQEFYIDGKQTLTSTYASMLAKQYRRYPRRLVPRLEQFLYHARVRLLEHQDANRKRMGRRLAAQYAKARTGQATRMTFGMNLEVVDIDGFVAKIPVAAIINQKVEAVFVTIIFAVSRRTGAVAGYEIAMDGENSESFRRCLASVFVPKVARARELGLTDMRGLLHGSIDAIFVDNGAGAAADVNAACAEMGLIQFFAPPQRGDLKATGESLNNMMVHLLKDLTGAFTRQRDIFSRELRRIKSADAPITVEQLETFLLMAIQHVNRYANKRHLRSEDMRKTKECSIHPASLWRWYQKRRIADQRIELTPEEAWERFIPWRPATVRSGKVKYLCKRWRSDALEHLYNAHMRRPPKTRGSLKIEFKRVGAHATTLKWRAGDGQHGGELGLTKEDADLLGIMTWKALEFRNADDRTQSKGSEPAMARSRSQLSVKQQKNTDGAERRRGGKPETSLEGANVRQARKNATVRRDAARFAETREGASPSEAGNHSDSFGSVQSEVFLERHIEALMPADGAYDDDLSARLRALTESSDEPARR